jgi:uncharacterized protein YerC
MIRVLLANGVGYRAIADRFGISRSTISNIHTCKTWKFVS